MSRESLRPGCRWPGAWTKCCCSLVVCRTPTLDFSRRGPTGELSWREMGLGIRMYTPKIPKIYCINVSYDYIGLSDIYIYIKVTDWGLILTTWLNQRSFSNCLVAPCYLKMAMSDLEDNEHQWLWNGLVWFIIIFLVASGSILFLEYPPFSKNRSIMYVYIYMYICPAVNTLHIFDGSRSSSWARQGGCLPNSEGILQDAGRRRGSVIFCSKTPLGEDTIYIYTLCSVYIYIYTVFIYTYTVQCIYIYILYWWCVYAESPSKIWQRSSQPLWNWCSWPVTSILRSACLGIQVSIRAPGSDLVMASWKIKYKWKG